MNNHSNENRYIIVANIPGPFLHADTRGKVDMLIERGIKELIMKLEPSIYNIQVTIRISLCYMYNFKGIVLKTASFTTVLEN